MQEQFSQGLDISCGMLYGLGKCKDTELIIPEGVEKITSKFAMSEGLERIESIVFPSTLKDMEVGVLRECKNLVRAVFKDGMRYARARMFENLPKLTEVVLPASWENILYSTFEGCKNLRRVVIPEGIKKIGDKAFGGCGNLEELSLPDSLTSVSNTAFDGCKQLCETENGVTYVGNWVLCGNKSATEVTLREGTRGIASLAFVYCKNLKTITLPDSLRYVCKGAFEGCSALEAFDLPIEFQCIEEQALCGCTALRRITLPFVESRSIGKLFGCHSDGGENERYMPKSLKTVVLTKGTHLPEDAFIWCMHLEKIVLPDELVFIGESAFMNCESLTEIKIPDGVTEIGARAFFGCKNLVRVEWPPVRPKIGPSAFYNTQIVLEDN